VILNVLRGGEKDKLHAASSPPAQRKPPPGDRRDFMRNQVASVVINSINSPIRRLLTGPINLATIGFLCFRHNRCLLVFLLFIEDQDLLDRLTARVNALNGYCHRIAVAGYHHVLGDHLLAVLRIRHVAGALTRTLR
jgi:hypothetical protein